jgi:Protein of unknown function (DUF1580)
MIDASSESLIALADVPAHLPKRRGGKRPHVSCIYRWAQHGCKGVVLETLQCGGTKVTSREALQRFFERLSAVCAGTTAAMPVCTSVQRQRAINTARRVLDNAGF